MKRILMYHMRQKGSNVLLGGLFLAGAVIGTRMYALCSEDTLELLSALLGLQQESTLAEAFCSGFFSEGALILLLCFCGFCAIGQLVAVFLLLYRGLGLGILGTFLAQQGREAFGYYALILLPRTLLFLILQIAATRESVAFSMSFLRQLLGISAMKGLSATPRVYLLRFGLFLLLAAVFAFAGALLMLFLSRLL